MSSSKSCTVCGIKTNLKSCSRCLSAHYCCRDHQQIDWKSHRINCKQIIDSVSKDNNIKHIINNSVDNLYLNKDINQDIQTNCETNIIDTSHQTFGNHKPEEEEQVSEEIAIESQMAGLRVQESAIVSSVNYNHNNQLNSETNSPIFLNNIPQNSGQNSLVNGFNNNRNNDSLISTMISKQENIMTKLNSYCESILKDLNEFGFCVIDEFLSNGSDILSEVHNLYKCGLFRAGQVVNNKASNTHLIRGDHIVWVDGTEQMCTNIGFLVQTLDSIVMRCNTMRSDGQFAKYKINRRTKAMIACYPGNHTKYVRHIDNPNNDGRCITSIYYLNQDYDRQRDGGVLRLFPQINKGCVADIEPKFNRVIFFWSDRRNPHEVMPSTRMRFAITVWYFDANEREIAIERYRQQSLQYPVDKDLRPF